MKMINIENENEMNSLNIDCSVSGIACRALPDVRDGMNVVQRRILFCMSELGNTYNKPSARIVGKVLGKYHPHGDSSVYMAMVRMAQDWVMRYNLIDGLGNFGSIDGDEPADIPFTEAGMSKIAKELLVDIDKETVDFQPNFDDSLKEPTVLPARLPNLLLNGTSGIFVGIGANMAPHNLTQTIDATIAYIDNNEIEIEELSNIIQAPDFPTGGIIYGYAGVKEAFETGRGCIEIRAKVNIETDGQGCEKIIVTEIPYLVNKAELIEDITALAEKKKVEGISCINDETDRKGMRIVIDVKRDANSNAVLNKLFKYSALQSSFKVNNIAMVKGRPRLLNLKELIHYFVEHREEVVTRRTQFELTEAEKRVHLLEGFTITDNLDETLRIIRDLTPKKACEHLMERFGLSNMQACAILKMRFPQLASMEQEIHAELKKIEDLKEVLANRELIINIIKEELLDIKNKYGDNRRTEINY